MYYNHIEHIRPEEILVYLRKSRTDDPLLTVGEVLAKHETMLDEWAERNLGTKVPEENKYREVVSGETIDDRPEVKKVLKKMESPSIKAILIVEVQRLSRGDLEDAGKLIKLLRYTHTLVITPMKTFDLEDEYDRDMFERELKRGNEFLEYQKKIMKRGTLLSVSQGNYVCSIPPYGYDKAFIMEGKRKCPTLVINEEQAAVVRMIFEMYVYENLGYTSIANRLNEMHILPQKGKRWSPHSLREMLANVHYIGKVRWNWRKTVIVVEDGVVRKTEPKVPMSEWLIYDGKHPAIISDELFNLALEKQGKNPKNPCTKNLSNPFSGLIFCKCGKALIMRQYRNKDGSIRCATRILCNDQKHCDNGSFLFTELMDAIVQVLRAKIAEFQIELQKPKDDSEKIHAQLIKSLEKKLDDIGARELALWESQIDPKAENRMPLHVFQMLTDKIKAEREETELALKRAYETMPKQIDYRAKIVTLERTLEALLDDNVDAREKNRLLKQCIVRIQCDRERPVRLQGKGSKGIWSNPPLNVDVKMHI